MFACWLIFAVSALVSIASWAGVEYYDQKIEPLAIISGYLAGGVLLWNVICHEMYRIWSHEL